MSGSTVPRRDTPATPHAKSPALLTAQAALRSTLRRARQDLKQPSTATATGARAFVPAAVASIQGIVRWQSKPAVETSEELLLWMGDRGRARKLGKNIRVLLLLLAEREPAGWTKLWRGLAGRRGTGKATLDEGVKTQLIPLIGRMRVDFRHVNDRRASSVEERNFVVRALRRHAAEALRQMDREEIDRAGVALRSGHGVLDKGFIAVEERLAESFRKAAQGKPGGEAAMTRCTQSVLALNCLKEALTLAVVEATPEQSLRRR